MIPKEQLGTLQRSLVGSVLTGQTLPGATAPIRLPDISWVRRNPEILLSDNDLAGSQPWDSLQVVSAAALPPGTAYLELSHSNPTAETVTLRLEVKLAAASGGAVPAGLSAATVTFRNVGGRWVLADEPLLSAN